MRVLTGAGVEAESELPFAGLHQLLWPLLDRAGELPDVQSAALRGAFGLSDEGVKDRFLVSVAVLSLLTAAAMRSRCCASSMTRTGSTARRPRRSCSSPGGCQADPIAILIGAREGDARRFDAHGLPELRLTGLSNADAAELLDSALPAVVREELVGATAAIRSLCSSFRWRSPTTSAPGARHCAWTCRSTERIERASRSASSRSGRRAPLLVPGGSGRQRRGREARCAASERLDFGPDALDVTERAGL